MRNHKIVKLKVYDGTLFPPWHISISISLRDNVLCNGIISGVSICIPIMKTLSRTLRKIWRRLKVDYRPSVKSTARRNYFLCTYTECWWIRDQVNSGPGQLVNSGPSEFGTKWFRDQRLVNSGNIWFRIHHLVPSSLGPEFTWSRIHLIPIWIQLFQRERWNSKNKWAFISYDINILTYFFG